MMLFLISIGFFLNIFGTPPNEVVINVINENLDFVKVSCFL